jgi:DNA-binding ferritin-like protein
MADVGRLISLLMLSRSQTHIYHLETKSFAQHKALQTYYDGIIPLLDSYAETYMGQGKSITGLTSLPKISKIPKSPLTYLTDLDKEIRGLKLPTDAPLRNIQDSIMGLILSSIYMLRNLH